MPIDDFICETIASESILDLEESLCARVDAQVGRTLIVGGHYLLGYCPHRSRLIPLVVEDFSDDPLEVEALDYAGGFPLRTFRLALKILERTADPDLRIGLLVNDHLFNKNRRNRLTGDTVETLRRRYFSSEENIPASFRREMESRNRRLDQTLAEHVRSNSSKSDLLPKRSFFFSEQALRNRFDNTTREEILQHPGFVKEVDAHGVPRIYFRPNEDSLSKRCLTTDSGLMPHQCSGAGCMGEILEFFKLAKELGYDNVVLMIPDECCFQVNAAGEAAVQGLHLELNIAIVTGVGGAGEPRQQEDVVLEPIVRIYTP